MKINLHFPIIKIFLFCFYTCIFVLSVNSLKAQACNPAADPKAYGNGTWIGHVYDHSGGGNPVTSPFVTYKGYTTEAETFDRNWGTNKPGCANNNDNFAVRYRMNKTFAPGNYTFSIGGDDGVRLSIDGGATWILSHWSDHSYEARSVQVAMSGNHNLVLEYYEKTGEARVSFSYTAVLTPTITLSTNNILAGTITQNTNNNIIYSFKISPTVASATLTGLRITTAGSYVTGDVTNLKVRYSVDATLDAGDATLSTYANPGTAGLKTFTPFTSQTIAKDATGYIFITADIPCTATAGNIISVNAVMPTNTTFSSGTASGTPAAGNNKTVALATPQNVTGAAASVANASSVVSWTAPTGCYSEIMIVASPAENTGSTPTGDGLVYTGNLTYGSGTTFGNGFVAYKGVVSPKTITGLINGTTYFYKIFTRNGTLWSAGIEVSATPNLNYCTPTTQVPNRLYINTVAFVGTMADPPINSLPGGTGAGTNGYSNFTTLSTIAKQAQGEGVNVIATCAGNNFARGTWRAWVDWNNNGIFENSERVYNTSPYLSQTANFGFKVPTNQIPGKYRIRLRVNNGLVYDSKNDKWIESGGFDFSACDPFVDGNGNSPKNGYGETEDYLIQIVENYAAKVKTVTPGSECYVTGGKSVTLKATASKTVTGFKWYDTETDSSFTTSAADGTGMATIFTTPLLSTTVTYYVTAYDADGESTFRTAVKAEIKPTPEISFTPTTAESCGETSVVAVSAAGTKEIVHLINENFEDGTLGVFTNVNLNSNGTEIDNLTKFKNQTSLFEPKGNVWFPAISSGFGPNKFALATSDVKPAPKNPVVNALTLTDAVDATDFSTLRLKLKIYYSIYFSTPQSASPEYVAIDISTDNGESYPLANQYIKFLSNQGQGSKFAPLDFDLGAYKGQKHLKFRILHYSWAGDGFLPDGVAVDDIELYGERPLKPSFTWIPSSPIEFYSDAAGTIKYLGTPTSIVYIKPTLDQMEVTSTWSITATATLTNGCSATGNVSITNGNKVWPSSATATQWNSAGWKPDAALPSAAQCVIIRKPLILGTGLADGLAKNITIVTGGSLIINPGKTLTVTNEIINNTGDAANFIVSSDANLLQQNDSAVNTGKITVKRNSQLKRLDYTYWAAPVTGQNLKTFSPGTLNNRFYTYNESNDLFDVVDPVANSFDDNGKGYAIRANNTYGTTLQTFPGSFVGVPNNGVKSIALDYTDANHGNNLVGNPYSSNINFYTLQTNNSALIYNTAYFWTNINPNPPMQGSGYPQTGWINNYAVLNGTGGVGGTSTSTTPDKGTIPNQFIKVGQGFIIKAKKSGSLNFKNAIRTDNSTSIFFNKNGEEVDRYWLNLTTPLDVMTTQLIGYKEEATNGFELDYDAPLIVLGSDAFYSILDDKRLAIQGKAAFVNTDMVPLGSSHYEAGNYTISLGDKEGVFADGQNIYLKDKQTGTVTNLSEGSYTFAANKGLTEGRFEILYQPETVLVTGGTPKEELVIYRNGDDFILKAQSKKITSIQVFDTAGRLIYVLSPSSTKAVIPAERLVNGVYVLKINQNGQITTKKIVR